MGVNFRIGRYPCRLSTSATPGFTRWGFFHNIGEEYMSFRYLDLHIAGRQFHIGWNLP